jgi:hypothetical protein
MEFRNTLEQT